MIFELFEQPKIGRFSEYLPNRYGKRKRRSYLQFVDRQVLTV